jgi:outer membrane protein assembly factor BamB
MSTRRDLLAWAGAAALLPAAGARAQGQDGRKGREGREARPAASTTGAAPAPAHAALFRGNARRTGVAAGAAPRQAPRLRWSFPTGDRVVASPVQAGGTLYVGSDDHHVYAIDATSGRQRWAYRSGGPVASTPAVADGRVHVASADGRFHAVDAATGALLWKTAGGRERRFEARGLHGWQPRGQTFADPFDVFLSSPVVVDGVVVVGSGDGHVHALDAASGEHRWRCAAAEVVHASPAVAQGLVVVGDWASRLYAIELASGRERWRFQAGTDALIHNQVGFQSSPAIALDGQGAGTVFVGCRDAHLYAIDLASGAERWRFSTGASWVVGSPAVHAGRVYFNTSDSSRVHAVDAATGRALWEHDAGAYQFASPVVAGSVLLLGLLNGSLQARDLDSGALLWSWRTPAAVANQGWVLDAQGRINGGWLFGGASWHEKPAVAVARQFSIGAVFSTPWVTDDGLVVFGSADGRVYALG